MKAPSAADAMSTSQKRDCLALADMMEKVKTYPGGAGFVVDLLLGTAIKSGLTVVDKDAVSDLSTAARDVRCYVQKAARTDISGLADKRLKALDHAIGKCEGRAP